MIYYVTRDRVTTIFPLVADCFIVKNFAGIRRPIYYIGIHFRIYGTVFYPAIQKQCVINVIMYTVLSSMPNPPLEIINGDVTLLS